MATARGKIGRLPADVRAEVCRMIRDNRPAADVIAYLAEQGVEGVRPQNVSSWKTHGFQEWARRQERLETMAARREFARELVAEARSEGDGGLELASDAASAMAVDAIQTVLEEFDPVHLSELCAAKPATFVALVDALGTLRKGDQAAVKLRMEFEDYRRRVRAAVEALRAKTDAGGQATAEDLRAIARDLYGVE